MEISEISTGICVDTRDCPGIIYTSGYATMVHSRGVQSASLYDKFRKPGNYVIMTSLMTS